MNILLGCEYMNILIKKATIEDVDNMANNRMDFLYKVIGKQQSEEFEKATKEYLYDHISDSSY